MKIGKFNFTICTYVHEQVFGVWPDPDEDFVPDSAGGEGAPDFNPNKNHISERIRIAGIK